MSTILQRWEVAPQLTSQQLKSFKGVHPILAQVLYNRGLEQPQEAYQFLYCKGLQELGFDPLSMKDMQPAVERIHQAIKRGEAIAVYGDFDADGVTATTLMMQVLTALGANAKPYIPHRVDEGYGLNTPALESLAAEGVQLVITVDCGIRSVQEIEDGKAAGLDIIVTDHHSIGPELPDTLAVINPQREDCPGDSRMAGVGVAFMVAWALLKEQMRKGGRDNYPDIRLSDLLDLVAIGTIADVMPLNALLNRVLVRHGLDVINNSNRPGIKALLDVAKLNVGSVTATDIGFGIGPRINAAGRLDDAMVAYQLLSAPSEDAALPFAQKLQELNGERQELTRQSQQLIREKLADEDNHYLIFGGDQSFVPGIVGLVAGKLTEEYYRPSIILEIGEEESRASCRSIPEFHVTQALDECADLLVRHGGHAMAAGFTVLNDNIPELKERMLEKAKAAIEGQTLERILEVDMELDLSQLNERLVYEIQALEPTGHSNRPPLFVTRNLRPVDYRTVGNDDSHLKIRLGQWGHSPIDGIGFRLGHWAYEMPEYVDVAYYLEINEWNGRRNLQMNVQDIRPAEVAADV